VYAIIETGGGQYKVSPESTIKVQKLPFEKGQEIIIDKVLAVTRDNGEVIIGKPYVEGASVKAEVIETKKDKKILVFKKKPRKHHKKLRGHRQIYTYLKIKEILA
jgi:large subunit ribosomal protein L21